MAALAELELLERGSEVAALRPVLEAARGGAGRLVVVEGPPGIGKTRLLAEARALAGAAGLEVLWGRGGEFEREFPYGVVRQLFEPVLDEELLSGAAGLAAPLFDPARAAVEPGADGSFATAHGLYWLLVNLSARRPVLVAVDDLQWADPPSLRFLAYVQRRLDGLPVVLAAGLRPGEAHAGDPPAAAVVDDPGRVVLPLRPLTAAGTARYVEATLERAAEPAFADACHTASGGNPLLLRELLIALRGEGVEPTASGAAAVHAVGSQALAGRVRLRLARLGLDAAALAAAAAVLGDAAPATAARLAELDDEAAAEAITRLVRADVLWHDPPTVTAARYDTAIGGARHAPTVTAAGDETALGGARHGALVFPHPVVRSAVYADIPAARRARLHAEAARLLAAEGAEPERVAAHLLHAPPAGDGWAVAELRRAAARSLAEGAADAAAAHLRRALDEPPAAADRAEVLLELGTAELRVRPLDAIGPLEQALALADEPDRRADTALELSRALFAAGRVQDGVDVLAGALDDLRASPDRLARLEAELVGLARLMPELHGFAAERLRRLRLPLHEPLSTGEAMLLASLASQTVRAGEHREDAVALARQALAGGLLLEELNSPAFAVAVQALAWSDELEAALAIYDQGLADARTRAAISRYALGSALRAGVALRLGALAEAEADARQALGLVDSRGTHVARLWATGYLAEILLERGEPGEAAVVMDGLELSHEPVEAFFLQGVRESRARLWLARNRPAEAVEELLALGRDLEAVGVRNPSVVPWRSLAALALLRIGERERERARSLAAEEVELARAWGAPRALGGALRALGLARGGEAGVKLLREASDVLAGSAARLERARVLADLGAALRRAGRRAEAREPLRAALDLAHGCGAVPLAAAAQAELVATGAKPRRLALSGAESLTPSERRVAGMAAQGLTNREIAQSLFVTPKTVEVHLSGAYRKLGIGSRTQLPAALAET